MMQQQPSVFGMSTASASGSCASAASGPTLATNAMNNLTYDTCAYSKAVSESVAPLSYLLDTVKYEHCDKCRVELGVVGGTAVSHVSGNLVDLENNLFGLDRPGTRCPAYKFLPAAPGAPVQGKEYIKPVQHPAVDTTPLHLRPCQMHSYPAVPREPAMRPFVCPPSAAVAAPDPFDAFNASTLADWAAPW